MTSPRASSQRCCATRGFTLLEILVALAVVALSLAAIGNLTHATLSSEVHIKADLSALVFAESLIRAPANRSGAAEVNGADGDLVWRVAPVRALGSTASGWMPVVYSIKVRNRHGGQAIAEIVRLVRASRP